MRDFPVGKYHHYQWPWLLAPAVMISIMLYNWVLKNHREWFQILAPSQCWEMIENWNKTLFPKINPAWEGLNKAVCWHKLHIRWYTAVGFLWISNLHCEWSKYTSGRQLYQAVMKNDCICKGIIWCIDTVYFLIQWFDVVMNYLRGLFVSCDMFITVMWRCFQL